MPNVPQTKNALNPMAEYRRTCLACSKVWHSLVTRENQILKDYNSNTTLVITESCMPGGGQAQAKRNAEANQSELAQLRRCPECFSANFDERIVSHESPTQLSR